MLVILKNNWARLLEEKAYLIVSVVLTICAVTAALVLTNKIEVKGNIAFVADSDTAKEKAEEFSEGKYFNVTVLREKPAESELLFHRYDAFVTWEKEDFEIDSIKGEDYSALLLSALHNPDTFAPDMSGERKIGTNIIGYMMMFLLMQGVLFARFFADDKEKQMIKRVVMSPISFTGYLLGHAVFVILLIMIPSFAIIAAAKIIGVSIGFTLVEYALLIGLLAFLSTAFALFLNSFFCVSDTANMLGSSIIVLTSILAGSFYSFAKSSNVFNKILLLLPQKDFIQFADALEKDKVTGNVTIKLVYVLLLSLFFFLFACYKTRKDYVYHGSPTKILDQSSYSK
jgi:ABC-2 type transport system permease protein